MFGSTFKGIIAGDRVKFRVCNGRSIKNGKVVQDYAVRTAKVNPLLLFEDHVVVYHGTFGQVVDSDNYLGHVSREK